MSNLNNRLKQLNNLIENVPQSIRTKIHSYIWNYEILKEYDNLSIEDFKEKIEQNYINLSNKSLQYKVYNLMGMVDSNGCYLYNHNSFKKYISYKNPFDGLIATNTILEDTTGEYLFNIDKSKSAKDFAKVLYLEYYNKHQLKVFPTFTNPSEYHYFKESGKKKNPKCKFDTLEETIEESIKLQIEINRYFYNQLKKALKRDGFSDSIDYIRMLEAHSNLSCHSHSLYFIDHNSLETFEKIFEQVKKKFKLNDKGCKLEIIEDDSASSYVSKYIIKTMNNEDQNDNFHNHYKRFYSQYRFFTSSNYKNTNQQELNKTYSYLKKENPKLIARFEKSEIPLYILLEKYINRNFDFEYETVETKTYDLDSIYQFIDNEKQVHQMLNDNIGYAPQSSINQFIFKDTLSNIDNFKTKIVKTKKIKYLRCKHTNKILKDYTIPTIQKLSINDLLQWYKDEL